MDMIRVELNNIDKYNIHLIGLNGITYKSWNLEQHKFQKINHFDISDITAGVYVLQIVSSHQKQVKKLIIER